MDDLRAPIAGTGAADAPITTPLDEALDEIGYGTYQRRLLVITALTQLADAMELMVISFLSMEFVWCHTAW